MDDATRAGIVATGWRIHDAVEDSLLRHPATKGSADWPDKQRLLLADMAIHLLRTKRDPSPPPRARAAHSDCAGRSCPGW